MRGTRAAMLCCLLMNADQLVGDREKGLEW
jgi:hypothetical protein